MHSRVLHTQLITIKPLRYSDVTLYSELANIWYTKSLFRLGAQPSTDSIVVRVSFVRRSSVLAVMSPKLLLPQ
jgi:hypothetical protein